jgi:hypothetical protein
LVARPLFRDDVRAVRPRDPVLAGRRRPEDALAPVRRRPPLPLFFLVFFVLRAPVERPPPAMPPLFRVRARAVLRVRAEPPERAG